MSVAEPLADAPIDPPKDPGTGTSTEEGGLRDGVPVEAQFAQWSENFRIGVDDIDDQHRMLFELINQLAQAALDPARLPHLDAVFRQLEEYTLKHFRDEEMLMAAAAYPDFAAHRASHLRFARVVADAKARHAAGAPPGLDTLLFFNAWLVEHIQREDQAAADCYLERMPPRSWFERIFRRSGER